MTAAILPPRAMRPARPSTIVVRPAEEPAARRILLMDLHDGPLPEERVGLLAAALRAGGHEVAVARSPRRGGRVMAGLRRIAGGGWPGRRRHGRTCS